MEIVSIITPHYNRAELIKETAASVLSQTNSNWEWLIVDDGSTDDNLVVLKEIAALDKRIKLLKRNKLPKGAPVCRNIGIENCAGNYVVFLDSDDLLCSNFLEQRLSAIKKYPECDFLIFPMLMFKDNPGDMQVLWNVENNVDDVIRLMLSDPICQTSGVIWKRHSFAKIGMWDEGLLLWQDVELHMRAFLKNLKFKKLMHLTPDVFIRISEESISRTGYNSLPKFKSRKKVFTGTVRMTEENAVFAVYKTGLQKMGFDLICSGINSKHFKQARELLSFTNNRNLFTPSERFNLERYYWAKKLRLYKLPVLKHFSARPVIAHFENYLATLNKIEYQKASVSEL